MPVILLIFAILCSGGNIIIPREPLLILIIILSLLGTKGRIKKSLQYVAVFVSIVMILAIFHPGGLGMSFVIRLVNFIAALALVNYFLFYPVEFLIKHLYSILKFLPFQAILTFLLAKFLPFIFMQLQINGTTYETLGLVFNHHAMLEADSNSPRPDGFFYEPGVFQFYLNLCLYFSLFIYKDYFIVALSIVGIFVLQSSTGVLILMVQMISYLIFSENFAKYFKHWLVKVLFCAIIIPPIGFLVKANIENKIVGENSGSFLARQYDFLSGVNVVINHPILGIGFDYNNYKLRAGKMTFEGIGLDQLPDNAFDDRETSSNGLIFMLYSLGIPMSLFFILGLFRQQFLPYKILVGFILLMTLFGEMLAFTPFFLLFMFSAYFPKKAFVTLPSKVSYS